MSLVVLCVIPQCAILLHKTSFLDEFLVSCAFVILLIVKIFTILDKRFIASVIEAKLAFHQSD